MNGTERVLNEITTERAYQQTKWGNAFDDSNTPHQWVCYITAYSARNVIGAGRVDTAKFRTDMVKAAAIAVAAVEAIDRAADAAANGKAA